MERVGWERRGEREREREGERVRVREGEMTYIGPAPYSP